MPEDTVCDMMYTWFPGIDVLSPTGKTTMNDPSKELELSFANLQHDFLAMIQHVFPDPQEAPDLVVSLSTVHRQMFAHVSVLSLGSCLVTPWEHRP